MSLSLGTIIRAVKEQPVEIIRSPRRRKTVEARRVNGVLEVRVPASMPDADVRKWVRTMRDRVSKSEQINRLNKSSELENRARRLHEKYFHGRPALKSIRYVSNQRGRFGSCTPEDGTIRLSHVLADYPAWVRDYVIVHELAHLRVPDHSRYFWQLVERYPHTERARGFLIAKGLEE
jgi:predicted metal-dependent hydrolase